MKNYYKWTLILVILTVGSIQTNAQTVDSNYLDGVLYIKVFNDSAVQLSPYDFGIPALNAAYISYEIDTITQPFLGLNKTMDQTFRLYFDKTDQIDALKLLLETLPFVEYVEKSPIYKTFFTPNDLQAAQWYLKKVEAEKAWDITKGDKKVVVAVVDNGVNTNHEDLKGNIWVNGGEIAGNGLDDDFNGYTDDINGYDVADGDANPNPPSGIAGNSAFVHGTLCAGIVSAVTNNNVGIASLGNQLSIMAVKCSSNNASDEGKSITSGYDGVYYATRAGADVISLSWGGSGGLFITGENIINAANQLGIVVLAAAGNSNTSDVFYPAGYTNVIAVAATDQDDKRASFSNYGSYVDVSAPGVSIFTTNGAGNNAYSTGSGTSMSCPLTAALCGLILSQQPSLSPSQVKTKLKSGADNIDGQNSGFEGKIGVGRINAFKTLGGSVSVEKLNTDLPEIRVIGNEIILSDAGGDEIVTMYDAAGRRYPVYKLRNGTYQFNEGEGSGMYFLQVISPTVQFVKRVFISR